MTFRGRRSCCFRVGYAGREVVVVSIESSLGVGPGRCDVGLGLGSGLINLLFLRNRLPLFFLTRYDFLPRLVLIVAGIDKGVPKEAIISNI